MSAWRPIVHHPNSDVAMLMLLRLNTCHRLSPMLQKTLIAAGLTLEVFILMIEARQADTTETEEAVVATTIEGVAGNRMSALEAGGNMTQTDVGVTMITTDDGAMKIVTASEVVAEVVMMIDVTIDVIITVAVATTGEAIATTETMIVEVGERIDMMIVTMIVTIATRMTGTIAETAHGSLLLV